MPVKSKEFVSKCEINLDIEVEPNQVAQAVDRVYREFSRQMAVPGFRAGKAPMAFVKQRVSESQLRERTVELLVGRAYEDAIVEAAISPYGQPKVELVRLDTAAPDYGFEFKALVPLAPSVVLGEYKGLEVERNLVPVTDADVDEYVERFRESMTKYEPITDRAAAIGDAIRFAVRSAADAESLPDDPQLATIVIGGERESPIPGFDDAIVGILPGETRQFDIASPEQAPDGTQAGSTLHFEVSAIALYSRDVPTIDDEYMARETRFASVEEFRQDVRQRIERDRLETADSEMQIALIDQIVAGSTIDYPTALYSAELAKELDQQYSKLNENGMSPEDYAGRIGLSVDEWTARIGVAVDRNLRRGLVISQVAISEQIEVTEEDIDRDIRGRAAQLKTTPEAVRAWDDRADGQERAQRIFTNKVIDFLVESAKIIPGSEPAPAEAAPDAEKKPAKKPRKNKADVEAAPAEAKAD